MWTVLIRRGAYALFAAPAKWSESDKSTKNAIMVKSLFVQDAHHFLQGDNL